MRCRGRGAPQQHGRPPARADDTRGHSTCPRPGGGRARAVQADVPRERSEPSPTRPEPLLGLGRRAVRRRRRAPPPAARLGLAVLALIRHRPRRRPLVAARHPPPLLPDPGRPLRATAPAAPPSTVPPPRRTPPLVRWTEAVQERMRAIVRVPGGTRPARPPPRPHRGRSRRRKPAAPCPATPPGCAPPPGTSTTSHTAAAPRANRTYLALRALDTELDAGEARAARTPPEEPPDDHGHRPFPHLDGAHRRTRSGTAPAGC